MSINSVTDIKIKVRSMNSNRNLNAFYFTLKIRNSFKTGNIYLLGNFRTGFQEFILRDKHTFIKLERVLIVVYWFGRLKHLSREWITYFQKKNWIVMQLISVTRFVQKPFFHQFLNFGFFNFKFWVVFLCNKFQTWQLCNTFWRDMMLWCI